MSRQPEIMGKMLVNMILAMAIMETALVFGLIISIILLGRM